LRFYTDTVHELAANYNEHKRGSETAARTLEKLELAFLSTVRPGRWRPPTNPKH